MFISTQVASQVAAEYLQEVILPKVATPVAQFGMGFLMSYVDDAVKAQIAENMPVLTMLGIVDKNGKIDLDKARAAALKQLERQGGTVAIKNYNANKDDIEALYKIAQRHATTE